MIQALCDGQVSNIHTAFMTDIHVLLDGRAWGQSRMREVCYALAIQYR